MTGRDTCALGDGQPIDRNAPEWMLCTECLDEASALADEQRQAAGYRDGLDVTNRRPTLPEFQLRRF